MPTFAERIRTLRNSKGLSQRVVGESLGINERTYKRYEAGEFEPTATNIIKLANLFEVSADYILGLSDNPQRQ
ncbi:MAG: helix-turn-helix domain-containing protein [Defluviitaleaceae bacterium]|nr:helix-turn-helix domain-containing protein [Defluviitaleaceae bacterium]